MSDLFVTYVNLSVGFRNNFSRETHQTIVKYLRENFLSWKGFFKKYPDYDIGFIVATKKEIDSLEAKGPSVSRKMKVVDYAIWLPDKDFNISQYLDYVFDGISMALQKYKVEKDDLLKIKQQCKKDLKIISDGSE